MTASGFHFGPIRPIIQPPAGRPYPGGHLIEHELSTGKFRDFGVIHYRDNPALHVARARTGAIEHFPDALPPGTTGRKGADPWYGLAAIDENRALVAMEQGLWIFDSCKVGSGDCPFTPGRPVPTSRHGTFLSVDAVRFYWTVVETGAGTRVWSTVLSDPSTGRAVDHGLLTDAEGRPPLVLGDMASAGKGWLYLVGRWNVRDSDMDTIGIIRRGRKLAVRFSVADVSKDPEAPP